MVLAIQLWPFNLGTNSISVELTVKNIKKCLHEEACKKKLARKSMQEIIPKIGINDNNNNIFSYYINSAES